MAHAVAAFSKPTNMYFWQICILGPASHVIRQFRIIPKVENPSRLGNLSTRPSTTVLCARV